MQVQDTRQGTFAESMYHFDAGMRDEEEHLTKRIAIAMLAVNALAWLCGVALAEANAARVERIKEMQYHLWYDVRDPIAENVPFINWSKALRNVHDRMNGKLPNLAESVGWEADEPSVLDVFSLYDKALTEALK